MNARLIALLAVAAEVADDPPAPVVVARRRVWVHSINRGRGKYGEYHRLCQELHLDEDRWAEDWREIAGDYEKLAHFPNCLCAIDGKHVGAVQSIPRVGSNNASREAVAPLPGRVTWHDGI
ncbi:unnamed protein product [Arctogadus glacialis]